jgi:hypothetical protein
MDANVEQRAQALREVLHVDTGPAIDVRRVFAGEQVYPHSRTLSVGPHVPLAPE